MIQPKIKTKVGNYAIQLIIAFIKKAKNNDAISYRRDKLIYRIYTR